MSRSFVYLRLIVDNAHQYVFSGAVSPFHQPNLYIQLEVPDAVLALQEAVFIFLYGTFLQTRILIEEICKDLRTGFVVAKYLPLPSVRKMPSTAESVPL